MDIVKILKGALKQSIAGVHSTELKKTFAPMGIFFLCALFGTVFDYFLMVRFPVPHGHIPAHFCFGLGFPMLWVALFAAADTGKISRWADYFVNKRFLIGAAITVLWSIGNEMVIHFLINPRRGADWDHFAADLVGIAVGYYLFFRRFPRCLADSRSR